MHLVLQRCIGGPARYHHRRETTPCHHHDSCTDRLDQRSPCGSGPAKLAVGAGQIDIIRPSYEHRNRAARIDIENNPGIPAATRCAEPAVISAQPRYWCSGGRKNTGLSMLHDNTVKCRAGSTCPLESNLRRSSCVSFCLRQRAVGLAAQRRAKHQKKPAFRALLQKIPRLYAFHSPFAVKKRTNRIPPSKLPRIRIFFLFSIR